MIRSRRSSVRWDETFERQKLFVLFSNMLLLPIGLWKAVTDPGGHGPEGGGSAFPKTTAGSHQVKGA